MNGDRCVDHPTGIWLCNVVPHSPLCTQTEALEMQCTADQIWTPQWQSPSSRGTAYFLLCTLCLPFDAPLHLLHATKHSTSHALNCHVTHLIQQPWLISQWWHSPPHSFRHKGGRRTWFRSDNPGRCMKDSGRVEWTSMSYFCTSSYTWWTGPPFSLLSSIKWDHRAERYRCL